MTIDLSALFEDDRRIDWIEFCFDTGNPPLAFFPHCIFRQSRQSLMAVLRGCNSQGGVFCRHMPWNADGTPFEGTSEQAMAQFSLWEKPENQAWVLEFGGTAQLAQFTAVVDSRADTDVLLDMCRISRIDEFNLSCYGWWINHFQRWLPELTWAYLPLADDSPWGMFVSTDRSLRDAVVSEFDRNGMRWFSMGVDGDAVTWPKVGNRCHPP